MIFNSIRWRLQLWYGVILLAVLVGFGVTAYQLESGRQSRRRDAELMRRMNVLTAALGRPNPRERGQGPGPAPGWEVHDGSGLPLHREPLHDPPPWRSKEGRDERPGAPPRRFSEPPMPRPGDFRMPVEDAALFDEASTNGFYFAVWNREGSELARSTNAPAGIAAPPSRGVRGVRQPYTRGVWREIALQTPPGERLVVGCSILPDRAELRLLAVKLAGVGGVILALGLAGGWWIATRAIRPIRSITETAMKISDGDLSQRISMAETESELGQLAGILNATFSRLDNAFRQQQQFTSDAAHELRTPVSVILTQTQTALNRERSASEYRGTLEACQRSAQRMRRLIESLLALARLDAGQESLQRSRVDLARVASECVEMIRPLAAERQIRIESRLEPMECVGDSDKLAQVITNLLSNAVHYNRDGGEILVAGGVEREFLILSVADTGPGIAPEHQARVFERFYRVDAARTTTQGRSGLGLAISRAIIDAHGGAIELSSEPGRGTIFTVRLPRSGFNSK